jgi:hypothetical protein
MKALVLALLAITLAPERADACSCGRARMYVSPSKDVPAPVNTTVMVWIPDYAGPARSVSLSLREQVSGDPVTVTYKTSGVSAVSVVELVPSAPLKSAVVYEVVSSKQGTLEVVGEFTTGSHTLAKPPAWSGVKKSGFYKGERMCCTCVSGDAYAEIEVGDPGPAWAERRFAIWVAGKDGKVDYTKPPVTYQPGEPTIILGHPSTCGAEDFTFPKTKALRLGLKVIDLAGNVGPASELVLDTTKPTPTRGR